MHLKFGLFFLVLLSSARAAAVGSIDDYGQNITLRYPEGPPRRINQGRITKIQCTATDCAPRECSISWFKDGRPLAPETRRQPAQRYVITPMAYGAIATSSLELTNAQREDGGNYTCEASTGVQTRTMPQPYQIIVLAPPHFTLQPEDKVVDPGAGFEMRCLAAGPPDGIRITWFKNGDQLTNPRPVHANQPITVDLADGVREKTSFYCRAENERGEQVISRSATVTPRTAPERPELTVGEVRSNSSELQWTFGHDGLSPLVNISVQYRQQDAPDNTSFALHDPELTRIKLVPLRPFTTYRARIAVSNKFGTSQWTPWVSFKTLAARPTCPTDIGFSTDPEDPDQPIELKWSPPANPNGVISGYVVNIIASKTRTEAKYTSADVLRFDLSEVSLADYSLQVRAQSQAGQSPPCDILHVRNGRPYFPKPLESSNSQPEELPKDSDDVVFYFLAACVMMTASSVVGLICLSMYRCIKPAGAAAAPGRKSKPDIHVPLPLRPLSTDSPRSMDSCTYEQSPNPTVTEISYVSAVSPSSECYFSDPAAVIRSSSANYYAHLKPHNRQIKTDSVALLQTMDLSKETKSGLCNVLIDIGRLRLGSVLGEGEFGCVMKGKLVDQSGASRAVAVKTIKEIMSRDELEQFIREGMVMKEFSHPNVLGLVGVCLEDQGPQVKPYVVLPFMKHGDLHAFLLNSRVGKHQFFRDVSMVQLVDWCIQIAEGMRYLSSKNFIHRDLAARNCMLDQDWRVKVADFGLSRRIYSQCYYRQGSTAKLPVKWMALECLGDRIYTTQSDVWSFGVTMWEIFSRSQTPYPGIGNHEIYDFLQRGHRLKKPDNCYDDLYELMSSCWKLNPIRRPTFIEIVTQLEAARDRLLVRATLKHTYSNGHKPMPPRVPQRQGSQPVIGHDDSFDPYSCSSYDNIYPTSTMPRLHRSMSTFTQQRTDSFS